MDTSRASLDALIGQISAETDDALEQLGKAVRTAADIAAIGDQLVGHFVDIARASGASWAEIGQQLGGVSKQAAQQRFSPDFSKFTEKARKVVVDTQTIAEEKQHNYMGTEHILLALCRLPDALAGRAFTAIAGSVDRVQEAATARLGGPSSTQSKPRFTTKGKSALVNAAREALDLGHNYIGTEHLLLGLLAGPQKDPSVAYEVLEECGVSYQAARDNLLEQLAALIAKK
ncbi:MAG: Clp protease N-terminal domain-containing protein [Actinocatenispora sp.]